MLQQIVETKKKMENQRRAYETRLTPRPYDPYVNIVPEANLRYFFGRPRW